MRISLKRDIRGLMTEPFSNQYWIRAEVDQRGCMGVSKLVEAENEAILMEVENGT